MLSEAVEWSSIILCIRWIRRVTHEDDLDKAQCIHCLWLKSRWNRWEICEYDEMNFLFVCTWIQRNAVAWICVHVHAAECSGMKLISVCMQMRWNAAKWKLFLRVCERGERDKIMMNAYFIKFSNPIYTNRDLPAMSTLKIFWLYKPLA